MNCVIESKEGKLNLIDNESKAAQTKDFLVVTSFNRSGYDLYGRRFISSFHEKWPATAELVLTSEDEGLLISLGKEFKGTLISSLNCDAHKRFENRFKTYNGFLRVKLLFFKKLFCDYDYKYDAQKFAKKTFALWSSRKYWSGYSYLIWIDADTITHSIISKEELAHICLSSKEIGYLGRTTKHSECGIIVFNLKSLRVRIFVQTLSLIYRTGLFRVLREYHDSYVFDKLRILFSRFPIRLKFVNWNILDVTSHPLINSHWGRFLDHLKGQRKHLGSSPKEDLEVERDEDYWNSKP